MTLLGRPTPDPVIFRGPLGEITRRIEPWTDADIVGLHVNLLAMTGAVIGRDTYVSFGARHPLLIWPILLGRTSLGRKGTATDRIVELFELAFPRFMVSRCIYSMPASGAAIVAGITRRAVRLEGLGSDVYEDDTTGEDEENLTAESGVKRYVSKPGFRGVIIETEMRKVLDRAKMDSDMSPILRKLWEGGRIVSETKKEIFVLNHPNVAIICHIPPKEFVATYSAADAAGGSMNRMLPCFVHRSRVLKLPKPVPDEVMERTAEAISGIVEYATVGELAIGSDAEKLWVDQIWDEIDEVINQSETMEEFAGRAMPYCWRIAGLYAVARKSSVINAHDLESAYALVRYMLDSVTYVFSEYAASLADKGGRRAERAPFVGDPRRAKPEQVAKLVKLVKSAGEAGLKTREITPRMGVSADQFGHIGAAAEAAGLVERYRVQGPTGAPGFVIVYTGPQDAEPAAQATQEDMIQTPRPKQAITRPLSMPSPSRMEKITARVNGSSSSSDDLMENFF